MRSSTSCPKRLDCSASTAVDMRELADVGAGDERLVAGSGQDDAAHRGVIPRILEGGSQILPGRRVQRVEHLGPIDRHIGDARPSSRTGRSRASVLPLAKLGTTAGEGVNVLLPKPCSYLLSEGEPATERRPLGCHTKAPRPVMALPTIRFCI